MLNTFSLQVAFLVFKLYTHWLGIVFWCWKNKKKSLIISFFYVSKSTIVNCRVQMFVLGGLLQTF